MKKKNMRKWMAVLLSAGIIVADFQGIPMSVFAAEKEESQEIQTDQEPENLSIMSEETQQIDDANVLPDQAGAEETEPVETESVQSDDAEQLSQNPAELAVTITSSKTTKEYVDRSIELTASAEGADAKVQYQYTEEYNGQTTIVQEYSDNPVYSFKTSGVGKHTYRVEVKDENGNTGVAEYVMEVVAHPSKILAGSLTSNKTQKEYVDRNVTLTADVTGGYGDCQYQFTEVNDGQETVLQEYSEKNTYSFQTKNHGDHLYYVYVKDTEGQELKLSYSMTVVIQPQKVLKGEISSTKSNREYVDRTVTLTGKATGGYGKLEYRFTDSYNDETTVVQEYSESNTYTFVTSQPGIHTYKVDIRDEEGQTVTLTYSLTVVLNPKNVLTAQIKSNKTTKEYVQRSVVLTGIAKGGYGKIRYRFSEVYGATTTIKQDYSENNSYSFVTTGPGHHVFYVDMIDEQGQKARAAYEMDVVIHPDYVLKGNLTSNKSTREYIERGVSLTATSKGGYGSLKYQFIESYNGKETVVQKYSESNTYSFVTTGPGKHTYYVDIKDSANQIVRAAYSMTVVVHPDKVMKVNLQSNKSNREYARRGITLTGNTSGGYGDTEYQFTEVYGATTKIRQGYSSNSTYSFTTTGIGTHVFYVDAKDKEGQIVRASYTMQVVVHPDYQLRGSFTSNTNGKAKNGQNVQLNATSTGGYGNNHRYRFREVYGGKTKVLQNYTTAKTCSFTFSGNGTHKYYVDILDDESQILTLSLTITSPEYSDRMSVFSTVSTNNANGTYNMSKALKSFNQVVIQPGQTLSFFGVAGPCGKAEGYKPAGVVGGVGYGGGICQASTTLYGAAIRAGLTIVQRRNHSVPSTYVPIGQDAMVDYGSSDLKFRNDYDYPVKLVTYVNGNTLYAEVWGIQPDWYDYINVRSWSTGSKTAVAYRDYIKNGKTVKTEQLPSSYYK